MGEEKPGNDKPDSSNGRPESAPLGDPIELKNNARVANAEKAESAKRIFEPFLVIWEELQRFWIAVRRPENSNGIIAIATVVIAGMAFLQWLEMRDAGIQTDRIIVADERLANAMEGSVAQAKNAFDAANKQAILSQRAWIANGIHLNVPKEGTDPFVVGQPLDIRVNFKNTGRTPALNVSTVTERVGVESKHGTFKEPNFTYKPEQYVFAGNLTPDGEIFSDFIAILTPIDRDRILSNKVRVFIHGRVEYDDVFGKHHWRNFCGFLLPGGAFGICSHHTDMDQN